MKNIYIILPRLFLCKKIKISKQYHHEEINKYVIQVLNKLDMSYNTASLDYTHEKFKDTML